MKKTKKPRKRRTQQSPRKEVSTRASWVDRVHFASNHAHGDRKDNDDNNDDNIDNADPSWISIISWNVLAHSYCSRSSQRNLPVEYQKVVFHAVKRKQRILDILDRWVATEETDIICLQEVDMDEIGAFLRNQHGWEGIETPRQKNGGGSGTKIDSCIVFVNPEQWKMREHKIVTFDDLAFLSTKNKSRPENANDGPTTTPASNNNTEGLQQSFLRRNVGILVRLEDVHTGETFVVVNTHLFWNPNYEYVKFCQMVR